MLTRTNRTLSANLDRLNLGTRSLVVATTGLVNNVVALRAFDTHPRIMRRHAMRPDGEKPAAKRPWGRPGSSIASWITSSCRSGWPFTVRSAASWVGAGVVSPLILVPVPAATRPDTPRRTTRPATRSDHRHASGPRPVAARG
jgi:hypothetical protein